MWLRLAIMCIVVWDVRGAEQADAPLEDYAQWPLPSRQIYGKVVYIYNPDKFNITVTPQNKSNCPLIMATIQRFKDNMQPMQDIVTKQRWHYKNMKSEINGEESNPTISDLPPLARSKRELVIASGQREDPEKLRRQSEENQQLLKSFLFSDTAPKELLINPETATPPTPTPTLETTTEEPKEQPKQELSGLSIKLMTEKPHEYPYLYMNEAYQIYVNNSKITLYASEIWGIMRGMETVSQLFYFTANYRDIVINKTSIKDVPNYAHRGLLLDTAQHYVSVESLLQTLDAMAMNKMNVFHWLLVNDDSFPFHSEKHPELSEAGAYHPKLVYTKHDIQKVVEYARTVGIRVIPELDIPTNVGSIQASHPELILKTCSAYYYMPREAGILNPLLDDTYALLGDLYRELLELFPDDYLHIGGTRINQYQSCWMENPIISKYVEEHNITFSILLRGFYQRMVAVIPPTKKIIMWEDVFSLSEAFSVPLLRNYTVVEIDDNSKSAEWAINDKRQIVWSKHFKLGQRIDQSEFLSLYGSDPRMLTVEFIQCSAKLRVFVMGADVTVTTKTVDDTNIHSYIWPRASAAAEVLWTTSRAGAGAGAGTVYRAMTHACRMRRRGFPVPLPWPGACVTAGNIQRASYEHFENGPGRLL